jgi:signal transduction histidine kinase
MTAEYSPAGLALRSATRPGLHPIDTTLLEQPELLASLVAHRCALAPSLRVEAAISEMKNHGVNFAAVIDEARVLGHVSRHVIDETLGARFGFALNGRATIREFACPPSLLVTIRDPIEDVLVALNRRAGDCFYEDVMLVDESGAFVGFIDTRTLVHVQHELFLQKISRLAASTEAFNRVNGELAETCKGLVDASRRAGMAEVATGVLHNVGNALNSVNVSASVITAGLRASKADSLARLASLLREHASDLSTFLTQDAKGRRIPEFLEAIAQHAVSERERLLAETAALQHNVDHIKQIVAMQQSYATLVPVVESLDPAALMDDALRLNAGAFDRHGVRVVREFLSGGQVIAERAKVLQILLNLIRNAKYACDERGHTDKCITLRIADGTDGKTELTVADNGVGISAKNLTRIFRHGFTTRANGHGFGLHSSANAAREMKGALHVHSDGPGRGARFTLTLPRDDAASGAA